MSQFQAAASGSLAYAVSHEPMRLCGKDRQAPGAFRKPRIVVFGDDWGRHPSSIQHIVRHLLDRFDVDWVNTAGLYRPRLRWRDFERGVEKLGGWWRAWRGMPHHATSLVPCGLRVHAPIHWPSFSSPLERELNRRVLSRALNPVLTGEPLPEAVITTVPIVADLAAATPSLNWVYYAVDDFAAWPGLDGRSILALEEGLVGSCSRIIAASEALAARHAGSGKPVCLLTHGVDLDLWKSVVRRAPARGDARPRALFWGLADQRLDTAVCLALLERCDLTMLGPTDSVDPVLLNHARITWRGSVPYDHLPAEASRADVLVMPYADLPVTQMMQPLKLKEYMATPLPCVVTPIPAARAWSDAVDIADGPENFATLAEIRARSDLPAYQVNARQRLEKEGWREKSEEFLRLLALPAEHTRP